MGYVFDPAPVASVAVADSQDRFPVRRIFCVGRNYADHVREMGGDPKEQPPIFFTKPADAVVDDGQTIPYPPSTQNLHYEAELVVAIAQGGADIAQDKALDHVWGYGVGNDLTRRDLQAESKKHGRPWDMAKGFDRSAIIGPLVPVASCGHPQSGTIRLTVNGETHQEADLASMIWPVAEVIAILSQTVELQRGDLIMTGTPEGVGPLKPGDVCVAQIDGLGQAQVTIAK